MATKKILTQGLTVIVCAIVLCSSAWAKTTKISDVYAMRGEQGATVQIDFTSDAFNPSKIKLKLDRHDPNAYSVEEISSLGGRSDADPADSSVLTLRLPAQFLGDSTDVYVTYGGREWHHAHLEGAAVDGVDMVVDDGRTVLGMDKASVCQPQCTTYVYNKTKISFKKCIGRLYRDARYWYDDAVKCNFARSPSKPADRSIMVMDVGTYGHVVWVPDSKKESSDKYKLKIEHSNWDLRCTERKESVSYYKDEHRVKIGNTKYKVIGFIHGW